MFTKPNFIGLSDYKNEISNLPDDAWVRGMFVNMLNDRCKKAVGCPATEKDPHSFSQFPMKEYLEILIDAAKIMHPNQPIKEGIRRVGQTVYDDFYDTMIGKAIFSIAGKKFDRLAMLAPKAYEVAYSHCKVITRMIGENKVHVIFEPMHVFPDSFHIGAWENAAIFCGGKAEILIKKNSLPGHYEYEVTFTK